MHTKDKNGNDNLLYRMECPKCGQHKHFIIDCSQTMDVYDDDMRGVGDGLDFHEDSYCRCPDCDYNGKVREFSFGE